MKNAGEAGANVAHGGEALDFGFGQYMAPTVLSGVTPDMAVAREEVFGPVLSIIPFDDEEEAVAIANDTPYGLAAGLWTQSIRRAVTVSERLRAGTIWVNTYRAVSFMAPFGGFKKSGIGRENGQEAINEYLQTKSVWISLAEDMADPFVLR